MNKLTNYGVFSPWNAAKQEKGKLSDNSQSIMLIKVSKIQDAVYDNLPSTQNSRKGKQ